MSYRRGDRSLADAIEALPLRMREVLQLHAFERLPFADIAAQLDLGRGGVATQLAQALLHCRGWIAEADDSRRAAARRGAEEGAGAPLQVAADWFARSRDESVVARDHAHLSAWLARDERHRRAWLELRQLWEQIGLLATELAHALPPPMEVEPPQPRMRR